MATSLCSALLLALQATAPAPSPPDSVSEWWRRVQADSADAVAWLALGRVYAARAAAYHVDHAPAGEVGARGALDTAARAFARAAERPPGVERDTALAYAVFVWGEAALLAWEQEGIDAVPRGDDSSVASLRLPAVLAELGENLLRGCPPDGILLTAKDADAYAAWFLRFAHGLRSDLLVVPLATWREDGVFRARVTEELKLSRVARDDDGDRVLRSVAARRPLCASMALERGPLERIGVRWQAAPLVWMARGTGAGAHRVVPVTDFVFEAARLARDRRDSWLEPALRVYRRAAAELPALCATLVASGLGAETGCERSD